jgi:hypothetical protein
VQGGRPSVRWLVNPKANPPAETAETSQPVEIIDEEVSAMPTAVTAETYPN